MRKKKSSKFKVGMIVYIMVLAFAILIMDELLWTKLEYYEVTEQAKEKEQKKKIEKAKQERLAAMLTPSVTPTPTPAPIYMETIKIIKPVEAVCYLGGEPYNGAEAVWVPEEDDVTFASLTDVTSQYAEYKGVLDDLIPKLESTTVTIEKGTSISFRDADGNSVGTKESTAKIEVDGQMRTIRALICPYYCTMDDYDELTQMGFEFLVKFCLFCSNDKSASEMRPYFPNNSQYYTVISTLDNTWFNKHNKPPTYTEQTVREYIGYNDSLVYMDLTMHQSFVASYTGQQFDSLVEHPIWFVKIDGKWKVASIIFNAQELREKN